MPELPEAETIVRQIRPLLRGTTLRAVRHLRADMVRVAPRGLKRSLAGRSVHDVRRRAKRVVIHLDDDSRLVIGLGMTGHVAVMSANEGVAKHTHLRIALDGGDRELRFRDSRRFGGIWLLAPGDDSAGFDRLGVEPLEVGLRTFRTVMDRPRQIKALLLDQAVIAGMGNIYCDEALFRAGIHPLARAGEVDPDRVRRLHQAIRRVLTEAIAAEGSTIASYLTAEGTTGSFQHRLRVYGHTGDPCHACTTPIESAAIAGRTTHFCPVCQRR